MADNEILIRVKAVTAQAEAALKKFANVIKTAVAGALLFLASRLQGAALELYNFANASDRARDSLNGLTAGQAQDYIKAIQDASLGTISAFEAMGIANRSLFTGVVSTTEEMAKLTEVSIALGRVMGVSSTQALNDASLAIARQSKLIADNLGIIIDMNRVQAEANALVASGAEVSLDAAKQQAFLNQFLDAGNDLLERQGGLQEDNATAAEQLAARWNDLKLVMADWVQEAAQPTVESLNAILGGVLELNQAIGNQQAEAAANADTFEEYVALLNAWGVVTDEVNGAVQAGTTHTQAQRAAIAALRQRYEELSAAQTQASSDALEYTERLRRQAAAIEEVTEKLKGFTSETRTLGDEISKPQFADLGDLFDPLGSQLQGQVSEAAQSLTGGTEQIDRAVEGGLSEERIKKAFIAEMVRIGADDATVLKVKKAFGMLTSDEEALLSELNRLATLAASGDLSDAELADLGGVLGSGNFGALGGVAAGRTSRGVSQTSIPPQTHLGGGVGGSVEGGGTPGMAQKPTAPIQVQVPSSHLDRIINKEALEDMILDVTGQAVEQAVSGSSTVGPTTGGRGVRGMM